MYYPASGSAPRRHAARNGPGPPPAASYVMLLRDTFSHNFRANLTYPNLT